MTKQLFAMFAAAAFAGNAAAQGGAAADYPSRVVRTIVPYTTATGPDLLARTIIAPLELPVGIITAITGGTVFLWLLLRRS